VVREADVADTFTRRDIIADHGSAPDFSTTFTLLIESHRAMHMRHTDHGCSSVGVSSEAFMNGELANAASYSALLEGYDDTCNFFGIAIECNPYLKTKSNIHII
jgi:hypothetical protein